MTDKNNDSKKEIFETERNVERSSRNTNRSTRRSDRERKQRPGVPVYEQATSAIPAETTYLGLQY